MKKTLALAAAIAIAGGLPSLASAATADLSFSGAGIDANFTITYGVATDAKVTSGFEITGITGTFSDANIGISNASILGLLGINHATPESTNLLAPNDFSRLPVAEGLPPESHGFITYDNLYYPGGAPATATDFPSPGGVTDIYGIAFRIGNGRVVDLWSNGTLGSPPGGPLSYGAAVVTVDKSLDYVGGGVSAVPEPANVALLLSGLGMMGLVARRRSGR